MADHLNISRVIIPVNAGVLSAMGLVMADTIKDYSKSMLRAAESTTTERLIREFDTLGELGIRDLQQEGFHVNNIQLIPSLDLRYFGQSFEMTIPFSLKRSYIKEFHRSHQQYYGYHNAGQPVEIVNLRLKAIGKIRKNNIRPPIDSPISSIPNAFQIQNLFYRGKIYKCPVFLRDSLNREFKIDGPVLAAGHDSTTFVPPTHSLRVDEKLNLILDRRLQR
jgi:N-methylhydantoinase A/oxoprolinase/acetone carboxylase beta subunit